MTLKMVRLMLVSVVPLLFVSACTPTPLKSSYSNLDNATLSPVRVVSSYYKYVEQGNNGAAAQFLTPKLASFYKSSPDSDFNNVRSISNVKVSNEYNIGLDNQYKYEVQVDANYIAKYRRVITDESGPQMRFLYLGRNSNDQPWEIISIGTGP